MRKRTYLKKKHGPEKRKIELCFRFAHEVKRGERKLGGGGQKRAEYRMSLCMEDRLSLLMENRYTALSVAESV